MTNNLNKLTIDSNYRGSIAVSLLTIKKIILYSIRDITHKYFVDKVECQLIDNYILHVYISGKILEEQELNQLNEEINEAIMKELNYSLQIKPKNISIAYRRKLI
ncbi:MMB_0454 family protein [Spiroplasma endosymbiont of Stenodema calcarata]|uniref:MMB_0454 family protein n=1 Tax=Spiroplasma endosymbiont of Stenodema calcarata TaxID=3139328 RepID=UPI003CCB293E